jgi:hypothetical protein
MAGIHDDYAFPGWWIGSRTPGTAAGRRPIQAGVQKFFGTQVCRPTCSPFESRLGRGQEIDDDPIAMTVLRGQNKGLGNRDGPREADDKS